MKKKPLISCVCVTQNKIELLQKAISCFKSQDYPNKELVILCEDNNPHLIEIQELEKDPEITIIVIPVTPKRTLGELRNISIKQAKGDFFCQWDDDDWHHPERLSAQYDFLIETNSTACCLDQRILYDAENNQLYMSHKLLFEGSILMDRKIALQTPMYSHKAKAEDTDFTDFLRKNKMIECLNDPYLYIYVYHGKNTWDRDHFNKFFKKAEKLENARLLKKMREV